MSDNFCTTFLTHSGEVRGFVDSLFMIFYSIKCNFPFGFVILAIICAVGVFFILAHLKSSNIFITIAKIFLALILTALIVVSLIALFSDFSARITTQDSALGRITLRLAMQGIPFFVRNLIIIALVSIVLFIATRFILGRQAELHGDFWEHQNVAKSKVAWLNTLFFAMLMLIFICAFSLFQMIFIGFGVEFEGGVSVVASELLGFGGSNMRFTPDNIASYNHGAFIANRLTMLKISLGLSVLFILALWFAYLFKSIAMRNNGIDKLAYSLNADEIYSTKDEREKMLFGVVEEMAIASNMPMPRVFIMRNESGVNAMCSGERFGLADEKIAIFVTQGALDNFTRDELQGVIAHEFSHAFHGDVALNLKIFSLIFGLTWTMMIGEFLFRTAIQTRRSRSSGKNKGGGVAVIALIALVFYVLGFLGQIFAQIIQSAISRQKEFLADASSVQYTRNVNGIKSALKRIRDLQSSTKSDLKNVGAVKNVAAKPCAHMFFLNAVSGFFSSIFATHPSLEKRIKALNKIG